MQYFHLAGPFVEIDIEGEIGAHFVVVDEETFQKWIKAEQGFDEVREMTYTHSREKVSPNDRHVIDFNSKLKTVGGVNPGCEAVPAATNNF